MLRLRLIPGLVFVTPLLLAASAGAQSWPNDSAPGFDLQDNSWGQFWRLRQAQQQQQAAGVTAQPGFAPAGRAPIPMLDWAPPPPVQPPPRATRPRPRPQAVQPVAQPLPSPRAAANIDAVERSLAERERQLDAMRRSLEDDRRRLDAARAGLPR